MKFGLSVPNLGAFGDAGVLSALARDAETSGWDGFFVWDHILFRLEEAVPMVEPWTVLAAIATRTEKMTIGVMVTPISRRRPHVLARQVATVEQLAPGRVVLGAGLGTAVGPDFSAFGEVDGDRERAERLDEGLEIVRGLLSTDHYGFSGSHFSVEDATFLPRPASLPIWVGGRWPNKRPFRRAARYDGAFIERAGESVRPEDVAEAKAYCLANGASEGFEMIVGGRTTGSEDSVVDFARAGAAWYLEYLSWREEDAASSKARVLAGPPRG
jgi:alkanesulfonate monooxygenase SsuD/methylene tetrahydromethanopterin reductase-like flavin-dependent oxidoreductase (luciferase family)